MPALLAKRPSNMSRKRSTRYVQQTVTTMPGPSVRAQYGVSGRLGKDGFVGRTLVVNDNPQPDLLSLGGYLLEDSSSGTKRG
jgi:hypothetical protein